MDAVLIAACWLASTTAVILAGRHFWAHRCAECLRRHHNLHTGRHRASRPALAPSPAPADQPTPAEPPALALPADDPDATAPTVPARPRPYPRPQPRALPNGRS